MEMPTRIIPQVYPTGRDPATGPEVRVTLAP